MTSRWTSAESPGTVGLIVAGKRDLLPRRRQKELRATEQIDDHSVRRPVEGLPTLVAIDDQTTLLQTGRLTEANG